MKVRNGKLLEHFSMAGTGFGKAKKHFPKTMKQRERKSFQKELLIKNAVFLNFSTVCKKQSSPSLIFIAWPHWTKFC